MNESTSITVPPSSRAMLVAAALLAIFATASLFVDVPLARACRGESPLPGDIEKFLDLCEVFGHGMSAAVILAAMWTLDPARRRFISRVAFCAFGAGMMANLIKANVVRTRPSRFDFAGGLDATFGGFFPWWSSADWLDSETMSFPSAHTATAVGLAIGLSWAYPRGRRLFWFLAAMVAVQRISAGAHYLSDTLFGASFALVHCAACFHPRWYGRVFARWEIRPATGDKPLCMPAGDTRRAAQQAAWAKSLKKTAVALNCVQRRRDL